MRKITNLILMTVLFLSIMTSFVPSTVHACSCARPQDVVAQFSRSQEVFAGRVLEVKEQRYLNGSVTRAVLFEVSHIWKGGNESQIIIHTGSGGGDCGFHFEKSKEYLVYAHPSTMYGDKELLITIICDRTNVLGQAQEDLAVLGEGKIPTEQVNLEGELYRLHPYIWVIMIGIAVIGTATFFVWRKARK
ncbi:hypothetical protein ACFQI7_14110 [Paenibacillus allorhizosphaerae]|uniref:Cobalamin biosynthesis protein CbiN n=1 Tax=Paenibacillus allorhizosphaerae TaxID=2849866 RepID=A0ABN7TDR4_9BACL|nr:hypothetical protein [Paenibacillus allorhizosphaerae]CAG7625951.1 hypothetical protein PAECIP111802_01201 [Paenibacillus allorhizosphaerae]